MSLAVVPSLFLHTRSTALERSTMTATYTCDVFSSLDGYGAASGKWTVDWGKQGPEFLDHRLALYGPAQRMVFGDNTIGFSRGCRPRAPRSPKYVTDGSLGCGK